MESLLANYASSEEEEEEQQLQSREVSSHEAASVSAEPKEPAKTLKIFSFLPQPKSSAVFSSVIRPKSNPASESNPRRVVQFKPPLNPSLIEPIDEDEDEEEEERKPVKESTSSAQSFSAKSLFSILPAPKNSLGLGAGSALGGGRRSVVETDAPASSSDGIQFENNEKGDNSEDLGQYEANWVDGSSSMAPDSLITGGDASNWVASNDNYGSYGYYGNYESNYGYYDGSEPAAPVPVAQDTSGGGIVETVGRIPGKRGRDEVPIEVVEVKQDELMKNRPREDQVKLTGIAFGPAYQPVSTKGKPSKLHKRKHQIGSLFFDMKQREMELAERRARGLLTKAETQAKYGW